VNPSEYPDRADLGEEVEAPRDEFEYESAVLTLLLQEHRASQVSLLVFDVVGRLTSIGLVVYLGLVPDLSTVPLVSGLLVAVLVATFWRWGRHRATRRIWSVEETLSRMAGGSAAQALIESRFIGEGRRGRVDLLLHVEPAIWLCLILFTASINVVSGG
jgi:hypothetical protein